MPNLTASDVFQIVKPTNFLGNDDWESLEKMTPELLDTFEKQQRWRTETEMVVSVLNDSRHPTAASKYWQATREQAAFFDQLVQLSFDYRRNALELRKLRAKTPGDEFEAEAIQIDIEEREYRARGMELAAKDRVRELRLWSKFKGELEAAEPFDTKDPNTDQLIGLSKRLVNDIAAGITAGASISAAEAGNMVGLAKTALRLAEEKGLLGAVMDGVPEETAREIMPALGFKQIEGA